MRLKWIEIDLAAVRSNVKAALRLLGPAKLMAVVKADAYGHGAQRISRLALANGASCLGVLTLEEAVSLRARGVCGKIVLLAPPAPAQAEEVARARVETTVDSLELASALDRRARGAPLPVHADLDYGLGRWGLPPGELHSFLKGLLRRRRLRLAGLSAHIDYVPGQNAVEAEEKLRDFHRRCALARRLFPGIVCHAANTSILLDFPHWKMDMVRLGNFLYGINPTSKEAPLKDPWAFYARIISIKEAAKGRSIGYASEYVAPRRMRVATLPVGYSDGLTMEPAERLIRLGSGLQYWGMLRGQSAPFVGRCGISHVLVDITRIESARVGDPVSLPIRRTAASSRIPRIYKN
ncbi:MAG: alanine racemase [Elusimicrobia bacterium]|nr:alanine racemase [Elusimicrobiota bacterium]